LLLTPPVCHQPALDYLGVGALWRLPHFTANKRPENQPVLVRNTPSVIRAGLNE
jgi:hypothetical protein